jgi:hypothetical protein
MHKEVPRSDIARISAQFVLRAFNLAELMMIGPADTFFATWHIEIASWA